MRTSVLRSVMIFGVVVLHVPPHTPIAELDSSAFAWINAFFQSAVFRCAVPVLTTVSGYLLFRSGLHLNFGRLVRKKVRTLMVPFLVFNLPLVALAAVLQAGGGLGISRQLVPFDIGTWLDAAFGLTAPPLNYPLNFLRDLFVLALMAPLLGRLIRHAPLAGAVIVLAVSVANLDGLVILRTEMLVSFYLGGMAALHHWNLKALDRFALPCLALFMVACGFVVEMRMANTAYLGMVAPLLVWPAASLLAGTRFGGWLAQMSRHSFFLYLTHSVVLMAAWVVYQRLGKPIPYPLFWVVTPVLATAVLVAVHALGTRYLAGLFNLVLAARSWPRDGMQGPPSSVVKTKR